MEKNIRTVFTELINSTKWMDDSTKRFALTKLNMMNAYIAFPDPMFNNTIPYKEMLDKLCPPVSIYYATEIDRSYISRNYNRV